MKKILLFELFGLAVIFSGCVATQSDMSTLQERVVTTETKLGSLEKVSQQSLSEFEGDWSKKLAGLSEDVLTLRERISSVEGSIGTLGEQIRQETERSEKFRSSTSQDLLDFEKGLSARLDRMQGDLDLLKKTQAENTDSLETARKQLDKFHGEQAVLSERVNQVDTGLSASREEATNKLSIVVDEISKENQSLRQRISELEKKVSGKPAASKPAAKKESTAKTSKKAPVKPVKKTTTKTTK